MAQVSKALSDRCVRHRSGVGAAGQRGQFAVEALGFFEVRYVADAVVPGGFRVGAGREDVFGHRREYDGVGSAVGDEQWRLESAQRVVVVELAREEIGADSGRYDDVPTHRRVEVVGRYWFDDARPHERAHRLNVGRQVVGGGIGEGV